MKNNIFGVKLIIFSTFVFIFSSCAEVHIKHEGIPHRLQSLQNNSISFVGVRDARSAERSATHQEIEVTQNVPIIQSPYGSLFIPRKVHKSVRTDNVSFFDAAESISEGMQELSERYNTVTDLSMNSPEEGRIEDLAAWANKQGSNYKYVSVIILKNAQINYTEAKNNMTNKAVLVTALIMTVFVCPVLPVAAYLAAQQPTELSGKYSGAILLYDVENSHIVANQAITVRMRLSFKGLFNPEAAFDKMIYELGRRFAHKSLRKINAIVAK